MVEPWTPGRTYLQERSATKHGTPGAAPIDLVCHPCMQPERNYREMVNRLKQLALSCWVRLGRALAITQPQAGIIVFVFSDVCAGRRTRDSSSTQAWFSVLTPIFIFLMRWRRRTRHTDTTGMCLCARNRFLQG